MCSEAKDRVTLCLRADRLMRADRLKRTAANSEAARANRQKIRKAWDEIDANS